VQLVSTSGPQSPCLLLYVWHWFCQSGALLINRHGTHADNSSSSKKNPLYQPKLQLQNSRLHSHSHDQLPRRSNGALQLNVVEEGPASAAAAVGEISLRPLTVRPSFSHSDGLTLSRIMVRPVQDEVMEDVCCPANSVAISIPVISSSFRYLPPYTCIRHPRH